MSAAVIPGNQFAFLMYSSSHVVARAREPTVNQQRDTTTHAPLRAMGVSLMSARNADRLWGFRTRDSSLDFAHQLSAPSTTPTGVPEVPVSILAISPEQ